MPAPRTDSRDNAVGRRTSVPKLNGRVYTPDGLATDVVARLALRSGAVWLDPACGDGALLVALLRRAAQEGVSGLTVVGWDLDADALEAARVRLSPLADRAGAALQLVHRDALDADDVAVDGVLMNPPYLEAKRMSDAQKATLRARFPEVATGAFDLYATFLARATELLRGRGELAAIVPNRVLVTGSLAVLRTRLVVSGRVTVEDRAGRGDFGTSASVYPVVLGWRGGDAPGLAGVGPEAPLDVDALGSLGVWPVVRSGPDGALLARVLSAGFPRLDAHVDVRWTVSFHRAGLREQYVSDTPMSLFAARFLGGAAFAGNREVEAYRIAWGGSWIDHDEQRARADGNALPPRDLFCGEKVVITQNAARCRAALDREGFVLKDTFLLARAWHDAARWHPWLVMVLNSEVFHRLFVQVHAGTAKGGGFLSFLGANLGRMPLPPPPDGVDVAALHDARVAGMVDDAAVERVVAGAYGAA